MEWRELSYCYHLWIEEPGLMNNTTSKGISDVTKKDWNQVLLKKVWVMTLNLIFQTSPRRCNIFAIAFSPGPANFLLDADVQSNRGSLW